MSDRGKAILVVLILGILCPGLLFSAVREKTTPITSVTPQSVQQPAPQHKDLEISVLDHNGQVLQLPIDDYLTSVVLCEMPAEFETEALKAQAVVARTYALRRYEKSAKHTVAAVCMEPACCQGYKSVEAYIAEGGREADVEKIRTAVKATEDLVLTYQGELIEATYFSCSGGHTEDAKAVWGSDVPYLQATQSPGEESAAHYTDTVTFTAEEFAKRLGSTMSGSPGTWVEKITYTEGGGVETIRLCGKDYAGTTIRQLLNLRSTAFAITAVADSITITTKGFGHRVGMSQYGADAMAVQGNGFQQILMHYYQGVELSHYLDSD